MISEDNPVTTLHLAIFASGRGSNAQAIIDYFRNHKSIQVRLIVSNKSHAGVLDIAHREAIPSYVIKDRASFEQGKKISKYLSGYKIDYIILAGFLWRIPENLIDRYKQNILNIHPALLPKYGGKGMYGQHVHQAVSAAGEVQSGMTIHLVSPQYDEGKIIFQKTVNINAHEDPKIIAQKVLGLEHRYYPTTIEKYILQHQKTSG